MVNSLNVITFNVRGLGHPIKRKRVLTFLKSQKADVAYLQETHMSKEEHKKLKRDWVGQVYFSSYTSSKRGTAILIHKNLPFIMTEEHHDQEGRYVLVCGLLYGREIILHNIYAPNDDCPKFMSDMITLFSQHHKDLGIVAGDFNCNMDGNLDKSSHLISNPNASKALQLACNDAGLIDVWREFNPTTKDYSFYSTRHKTYSRLDYFLLPQDLLSSVMSCTIGPILLSDHSPVYLKLALGHQRERTKYWRFNASLLSNTEACLKIKQWIGQYWQENSFSPVTSAVIWDAAKAVIRGHLISYTSAIKKAANERASQLQKELTTLEQSHKQSPTEENLRNLKAVRANLNIIQTEKVKKLLFFTRQRYYEYGNKPSRLLAYQLKKEQTDRTIKHIRQANGQLRYDLQSIQSSFLNFYKELYTSENPVESDIQSFLEKLSLPSLSDEDNAHLCRPVTSEEVLDTIKSLPLGKSPGLDGYPAEFYKKFWPDIEPLFMPMVQDFFKKGRLPDSMKTAVISLIHKKDKDSAECSSYRPISLLTVDFKIISKLITRRLENLLPTLINPDQSGFVKARYASDNIRRLLDVIDYSALSGHQSLLISLDAEKAFDRVEFPYLFAVLKKFNFDESFLGWIRSLYRDPQAQVRVNGTLSDRFGLFRGCRQGCPLSPLLFNLAIEPLAEAIRSSTDIFGIDIGKKNNKISLYADDVILYLSTPEKSIPAALDLIKKFGRISGYKINLTKSNACLLNTDISSELKRISPFTWTQGGFKYLGINVCQNLKDLFQVNYTPLLSKIKEELEYWNLLPISFIGRINVIKMNVLPRFNYLFQSLPCYLNKPFFQSINKIISSFIWKNSTPRISLKTLTKSKEKGGLGLPDFQLYYWAAQTKDIISWIQNRTTAHWTDIEGELCFPSSIITLPFINNIKAIKSVSRTYVIRNTLQAWKDVKRFCGLLTTISILAPISSNPDLPPSIGKSLFTKWKDHGIHKFQNVLEKGTLKSFADLRSEFEISNKDFYKYLQLRHYIATLENTGQMSLTLSDIEEIMVNSTTLKGKISVIYWALLDYNSSSLMSLRTVWQRDLEQDLDDELWTKICCNVFVSLSCNKVIEQNYKFMHRMYLTPVRLSKMFPTVSPECHRCKTCIGSLIHVFWNCSKLKQFWNEVHNLTTKVMQIEFKLSPLLYLFGTDPDGALDSISNKRIGIIAYVAKKCILLNWNQATPPTINLFKSIMNDTMQLEQHTYHLKGKGDLFVQTLAPLIII